MPDWLIHLIVEVVVASAATFIGCLFTKKTINKNINIDKNREEEFEYNINKERCDELYLSDLLKYCNSNLDVYRQYVLHELEKGAEGYYTYQHFLKFNSLYLDTVQGEPNYNINKINKAIKKYNKVYHTDYKEVKQK